MFVLGSPAQLPYADLIPIKVITPIFFTAFHMLSGTDLFEVDGLCHSSHVVKPWFFFALFPPICRNDYEHIIDCDRKMSCFLSMLR